MKVCAACKRENVDEAMCANCGGVEFNVAPGPDADSIPANAVPPRPIEEYFLSNSDAAFSVAEPTKEDVPEPIFASAGAEAAKARPPAGATGDLDADDYAAIRETGDFVIGLVGFSKAGKTFFLSRLKRRYEDPKDGVGSRYTADPIAPKNFSNERITSNVSKHRFERVELTADDSRPSEPGNFWIIDIPGENFREAAEADQLDERAERFLTPLVACDAIIILLPASEVLAKPGDDELRPYMKALADEREGAERPRSLDDNRLWDAAEAEDQLENFVNYLAHLSKAAALLRQNRGDPNFTVASVIGMTKGERDRLFRGKVDRRLHTPLAYIAMSKADLLIDPNDSLQGHSLDVETRDELDIDPAAELEAKRPRLAKQIKLLFPQSKVDFLTSFENQGDEDASDAVRLMYDKPDYGVVAIIEWIGWANRFAVATRRDSTESESVAKRFRRWRLVRTSRMARRAHGTWYWLHGLLIDLPMPAVVVAALAVAVAVLCSIAWVAVGSDVLTGRSGQPGMELHVPPVLPIEIKRLESDQPKFKTGFLKPDVLPWRMLVSPRYGAAFLVSGPGAQDVKAAFKLVRGFGLSLKPDGDTARALDLFKGAGDARNKARGEDGYTSAIDFHKGLIFYRLGDWEKAEESFNEVDANIATITAQYKQGAFERIYGVRLAAKNALGLALLRRAEASPNLKTVQSAVKVLEAGVADTLPSDPAEGSDGSVVAFIAPAEAGASPLFELRHSAFAQLDTADLWTNLVAACIREDAALSSQGQPVRRNDPRRICAVERYLNVAAQHHQEFNRAPELSANLRMLALRLGENPDRVGALPRPDTESGTPADDVLKSVDAYLMPQPSADWADGKAKSITSEWRRRFADQANFLSANQVLDDLQAYEKSGATPRDMRYLEHWLDQAIRGAITEKTGEVGRKIDRNYAILLNRDSYWPLRIAKSLGLAPIALGILTLILIGASVVVLWRVRGLYRYMYGARHRAERKAAHKP